MNDHRLSTISQYSDSPSVYSRPYFSPRQDNDYDYPSPTSAGPPSRQNAPQDSASMLNLDEDTRTSYTDSTNNYDDAEDDDYGDESNAYETPDAQITRLSYLGPKMRFHSRAPWEMDDNALEEEDEPEEASRNFVSGFPFGRSKVHASDSSSPRASFQTNRPSGESSRSHVLPKRSFETINSQISYPMGALYTLAQESMSTTAIGRNSHPQKETLRSKFSLGRLRPDVPTSQQPAPPLLPPSPARSRFLAHSPSFDRPHENDSPIPQESMHPYANPDLVVSYANDDTISFQNSLGSHYTPSRNESSMTVTETFSSDSIAKSSTRSNTTFTPDSSISSITSKPRASAILAKNISSPVDLSASDRSQGNSPHGLPPGTSLPGWHERGAPPAFSLISLEEARAQRMRSATTANESLRISNSSGTSRAAEATLDDSNEVASIITSTTATTQVGDGTPFGSLTSRARGRSISAGAKAKNALQTIVGQPKIAEAAASVPPVPVSNGMSAAGGKTLKHKKSGFMRLFNGGKLQEKDDRERSEEVPPPVPSLPESIGGAQLRTPKSGVQRIPVPSLSPSLLEVTSLQSSESLTSESSLWKTSLSLPKRTPPVLSIRTMPQGPSARASTMSDTRSGQTQSQMQPLNASSPSSYSRPWANADYFPQSAPAHVTEFPALRLRPMSTLFSAHFGDHIVPLDSDNLATSAITERSSGESETDAPTELDTPRSMSPNAMMSPLTPASLLRTSGEQVIVSSGGGVGGGAEEKRALVAALQEQFASSKTAWERHIWELEGQVRDLKAELEETKGRYGDDFCNHCGRGKKKTAADLLSLGTVGGSVVNRPRARTGTSSRFGNALP